MTPCSGKSNPGQSCSPTPARALLLIFAKEPVPGQVKTRLSPPLSPAQAAELYRCFLADVMEEMARLSGVDLAVAHDPAPARDFFAALAPPGTRLVPQARGNLGRRLKEAVDWGFSLGYPAVLVRNSDSPDLPGEFVREGAEALLAGRADAVLGPCPDGGYYLVGLRQPCPELFQQVAWSTPAVLQQTLERAGEVGLQVHLLPPWPDIDDLAGLRRFARRPHSPPAAGWRSHAWLDEHFFSPLPESAGTAPE
ncbi:MAG: TIGR04282 family arsenosugar biosynthesis glycosyltransferase [Deltaproteobacteria bacterium]|nr:TIGR04282 family arsenosugar biosynthesis glycosyltransferase [Deltaproteobacteria bacterium]